MKKKKFFAVLFAVAIFAGMLSGCGALFDSYVDGTYEGTSSVYEGDEEGNGDGYGVVTITIENNAITACEYKTYQTDGTLKDEEYGKQNGAVMNTDFYNKAQRAVLACEKYAEQLAKVGDLSGVDAISGATISYDQFQEALDDALRQAMK